MKWHLRAFLLALVVLTLGCAGESKQKAFSADFSNLPNSYEYQITPTVFNYPSNWIMDSKGENLPQLSPEEIKKEREYHAEVGETIILWTPVRLKEDGKPDPSVRIFGTLYVNQPLPSSQEMKSVGEVHIFPQTSEYVYLRYRTRINTEFLGSTAHDQSIIDDYTIKIGPDLISIWVSYKDEETVKKLRPEVEEMIKSFRPREQK